LEARGLPANGAPVGRLNILEVVLQ
jgi:hypothetical protein